MAQCFAHKKPVVTSNLKSFQIILDQSKGGVIADDDKMADAIIKVLSDAEYSNEMKKNIETYIEKSASWSIVASTHIKIYQSVVKVPYGKARHVFWE